MANKRVGKGGKQPTSKAGSPNAGGPKGSKGKGAKAPRTLRRVVAGPRPLDVRSRRDRQLDRLIDTFPHDTTDPFRAMSWASELLSVRGPGVVDPDEEPFGRATLPLLDRCAARSDRTSLAAAVTVAAVAGPPLSDLVPGLRSRFDDVGGEPDWLTTLDQYRAVRAETVSDVFGDATSIYVSFLHEPSGHRLGVATVVDNNLGGAALAFAFTPDDTGDEPELLVGPDEISERTDLAVDTALRRVARGIRLADVAHQMAADRLADDTGTTRDGEFTSGQALVSFLLRCHEVDQPDDDTDADDDAGDPGAAVADLTEAFLASDLGARLRSEQPDVDVSRLAALLLGLRWSIERRPLRWSPFTAETTLLHQVPARFLLDPAQAAALPDVLCALARFAATRTGMDDDHLGLILEAVDVVEDEYRSRMADVDDYAPSPVLDALRSAGVDLLDGEQVRTVVATLLPPSPNGPLAPGEDPLAAIAAEAERIRIIDRIRRAQAFFETPRDVDHKGFLPPDVERELVATLGLDDVVDEDAASGRRSEPPDLELTLSLATHAGVLAYNGEHLVTTQPKRPDTPLGLWVRCTDDLLDDLRLRSGPVSAFVRLPRWTLAHLLRQTGEGTLDFDTFAALLELRALESDERLAERSLPPAELRAAAAELLRILGLVGLVEQHDAVAEPDVQPPGGTNRLAGGTVSLTWLGRWWVAFEEVNELVAWRRDILEEHALAADAFDDVGDEDDLDHDFDLDDEDDDG